MSWLQINNPEIDGQKLEQEIDAEVERLQKEKKVAETEKLIKKALYPFSLPKEDSYLLANLEKYLAGLEEIDSFRRTFGLRPFFKLFLNLLKRIFRYQYIFNSMAVEILKNQEKRIKSLEDRLKRSD